MAGCTSHDCILDNTTKSLGTNSTCSCLNRVDFHTKRMIISKFRSLDFYKLRVLELEKHKHEFPEPYYTMICNILANGKIEL
jgi:hypothetical protein